MAASGHRKRLRERYLKNGLKGFLDYETLELLLSYSIPRKDTKPLAKELIRIFGSPQRALSAPVEDLLEINGIGEQSVALFKLILELHQETFKESYTYSRETYLQTIEEVYHYLKGRIGFDSKESFQVIFFDASYKVITCEELTKGTVDESSIYIREIIEKIILYKAKGIIIAHNHPSGSLEPSEADITTTIKLKKACFLIESKLIDHIIVNKNDYFSFLESGKL